MKNNVFYSLSDGDISKYFPNVKIVLYNDLKNYDLQRLLGKNKAVIILIETTRKYSGHWMLVYKQGNEIYFFDSFGEPIEAQKKFIKKGTGLLDRTNYLSIMFKNSPYTIHYNQYAFQDKRTAVCGRWVIYRLQKRNMNVEQFKNHIVQLSNERNMHPDELMLELVPV
jgi:hypothetical protein